MIELLFHPHMPKHFTPNVDLLARFLHWGHMHFDAMGDTGRHWLFRQSSVVVANYWPAAARLHIHKDGSIKPTLKYHNIAPDDLPETIIVGLNMDLMGFLRGGEPRPDVENYKSTCVPQEQVTRKELKRLARIKILAGLVGSMLSNNRLFPVNDGVGHNIDELVNKAESALAAIEAAVDNDYCNAEDLHGK
jgi:hypothetical protein